MRRICSVHARRLSAGRTSVNPHLMSSIPNRHVLTPAAHNRCKRSTSAWKTTGERFTIRWSAPGGTIPVLSAAVPGATAGFISRFEPRAAITPEEAAKYPQLPDNWHARATILAESRRPRPSAHLDPTGSSITMVSRIRRKLNERNQLIHQDFRTTKRWPTRRRSSGTRRAKSVSATNRRRRQPDLGPVDDDDQHVRRRGDARADPPPGRGRLRDRPRHRPQEGGRRGRAS